MHLHPTTVQCSRQLSDLYSTVLYSTLNVTRAKKHTCPRDATEDLPYEFPFAVFTGRPLCPLNDCGSLLGEDLRASPTLP